MTIGGKRVRAPNERVFGGVRKVLAVGIGIGLLLTGFAAGRATVAEVNDATRTQLYQVEPTVWTAKEETIGRALLFSGTVHSGERPGPTVQKPGTVTAVHLEGVSELEANSRILDIDLMPIVAAEGNIPSFRDLREGDEGADVAQLRSFLCSLGYDVCGPSMSFNGGISEAVRDWQAKLGVEQTGVVDAGAIAYFPQLPITAVLKPGLEVGSQAEAGMVLVTAVGGEQASVELEVAEDQLSLVSAGAPVGFEDGTSGVLGGFSLKESGEEVEGKARYVAQVLSPAGTPVCESTRLCAEVLADRETAKVALTVQSVPESSGIGVPLTAIRTDAREASYVVKENGERVDVEIVASDGALALVTGLKSGERILVTVEEHD